jgi:fructokinase
MKNAEYRLGIDLGGTKIEGIVLTRDGDEIFRERIPTEQEGGYAHILSQIKKLYASLAEKTEGKSHTLGIGTPGAISHRTQLLKNSNTVCMNGRPLLQDLKAILGRDFEIQNDANCFALAEAVLGTAKGKKLVFGVIMGTGCGGGIVYDGAVVTGLQRIAGEWGHMAIDPEGPECYCGTRGCVETLISGGGLEKSYVARYNERLSLKEIVHRYREQHPDALAFMDIFFKNFGRSLANLINILDPDAVVLGGGVSNIDELYTRGIDEVARKVFSDSLETPILRHRLGDSAGVIGAALIGV